jgi:hypothetical protein
MDKPEQNDPQNDLFYQLMKDSRLHLDSPELEEDILRRLRQLPDSPHPRPATRTSRLASLFLSIAVIWGLALTALYATNNSPVNLPDPAFSLFLPAMLVLTFLFLLEKVITLLMYWPGRRRA